MAARSSPSNDELASRLRQIARHGQDRRYHHVRIGVNSRLDTIQAAVLLPKLAILDDELAARERAAQAYTAKLEAIGFAGAPQVLQHNASAWAQYTVRVEQRDRVQQSLQAAGVPTVVHYPLPLAAQPAVADETAHMPASDDAARTVLSLPMHPYLTESAIDAVVAALAKAL